MSKKTRENYKIKKEEILKSKKEYHLLNKEINNKRCREYRILLQY